MKLVMIMVSLMLAGTVNAATKSEQEAKVRVMLLDIEQAKEAKRYEKINRFKKELKLMNTDVQEDANNKLMQLQERLRIQERTNEGTGEGEQLHLRKQERNEDKESLMLKEQEMLQMQRQEQMKTQKKVKQTPLAPVAPGSK